MTQPHAEAEPEVGATRTLAQWVEHIRIDDLPSEVRHQARRSLVNIVGCIVAGSRHILIDSLKQVYQDYGGAARATLAGRGGRADVLQAALMNGVCSGIDTFDDTHAEAVVHPSGPVAASLLALAESGRYRGADLLLAFTLGVEIMCRLGKALAVPPAQGNMSWLQSCITAPPAVALACAKLLGLDMQQLAGAASLGAVQATGLRASAGSPWSRVAPGEAGQMGLKAALLARHGVGGGDHGIEGPHGLLNNFAREACLPALVDDLGQRYEILRNTFKPYPCGIVIHAAIDACLELRRQVMSAPKKTGNAADERSDFTAINAIDVWVNPVALTLTDRPRPRDALQAQVSLQHWVAAVLIYGEAGLGVLDVACIEDPAVAALRQRVCLHGSAELATHSARVTLGFPHARIQSVSVDECAGSVRKPLSDTDLEKKFLAQVNPILGHADARRLLALCWGVEQLDDAATLARALAGSA